MRRKGNISLMKKSYTKEYIKLINVLKKKGTAN